VRERRADWCSRLKCLPFSMICSSTSKFREEGGLKRESGRSSSGDEKREMIEQNILGRILEFWVERSIHAL